MLKAGRAPGASNVALAEHFEMHFSNRDNLPIPPELDPETCDKAEYKYLDGDGFVEVDQSKPSEQEIKDVLTTFKNRRCMGIDGIWGEQLKYGSGSTNFIGILVSLLALIWTFVSVPASWTASELSCLYKNKGSSTDAKNYRAISITATLFRLFSRIFLNRVRSAYNVLLLRTQCGFRTGVGTDDAIWGLSQC